MQQYFATSRKDKTLFLEKDDFNHIKNVMRMKENSEIIVVHEDASYICSLNSDFLSCTIKEVFKNKEDNTPFIVYMPLLCEEKMSFILQHGTELGVTEFVVVMYNNCKYKLKSNDFDKKLKRWSKIVKEASEQSYRIYKPNIEKIITVKDIKDSSNVKLVCSLDKENVNIVNNVLTSKNSSGTMSISFGPEGGLSEKEEDILVSKGFKKVSLGNTVLRTETVPLFIASVRSYLNGCE